MLIPLGILDYPTAVAGVPAYDLLETEILTGSQATVTFSSLGSYSDYQHFQIRYAVRTTRDLASDITQIKFNGDSGSNYSWHRLRGNGSAMDSDGQSSQSYMRATYVPSTLTASNIFGGGVIDILDPFDTNKNTTIRAFGGETANNYVAIHSGAWYNTAALTSITIDQFGTNFVTGSRFSLYGLKAA